MTCGKALLLRFPIGQFREGQPISDLIENSKGKINRYIFAANCPFKAFSNQHFRGFDPWFRLLAKPFPYHRAGKTCRNDLHILPGPLGEGLQFS